MRDGFSTSALAAGLLAAFVGFASSFAVILRGLPRSAPRRNRRRPG